MTQSSHRVSGAQIKKFAPLGKLSDEDAEELLRSSNTIELRPGEDLFQLQTDGKRVFYLIAGKIKLQGANNRSSNIEADSINARKPLGRHLADQLAATAITDCVLIGIDMDMLELFLNWTKPDSYVVNEMGVDNNEWVRQLLKSKGMSQFSDDQVEGLLARMNEIHVSAGDVVVSQDTDEDEYYYLIKSGKAAVSRKPDESSKEIKLAELSQGDGFGEEALLTKTPRSATVRMTEDGDLMRLSKKDFSELLAEPMVKSVDWLSAEQLQAEGAVLLDIRTSAEFEQHHLPEAINIPLPLLRLKLKQLDREQRYVAYCEDGSRSSAAAFIMNQAGLDTVLLDGGMAAAESQALANLAEPANFLEDLDSDDSLTDYLDQADIPQVDQAPESPEPPARVSGEYCSIGSTDYWGAPVTEVSDTQFEDTTEASKIIKTTPAPAAEKMPEQVSTPQVAKPKPVAQPGPQPFTLTTGTAKASHHKAAKARTATGKSLSTGLMIIGLIIAAALSYSIWVWLSPAKPTISKATTSPVVAEPGTVAAPPIVATPTPITPIEPEVREGTPPALPANSGNLIPDTTPTEVAKTPEPILESAAPEIVEDPAETTPVEIDEAPKKPALDPATRGFIE